jgi:GNAT superfamily N-acetyltransferase
VRAIQSKCCRPVKYIKTIKTLDKRTAILFNMAAERIFMDFTIEELSMNARPSIQTILHGGWILRMADGYTKRANSVNPLYSFDNNLDEKIVYCEKIYRENNLPMVYKIIECEEHKKLDQRLDELNYKKADLTSVQICGGVSETNYKENGMVNNAFTDEWKNCFYHCGKIEKIKTMETIDMMLKNIKGKIIAVYKKEKGIFTGCGYGVIEDGFVGIFDIIVKEEHRGKGYGGEIIETILSNAGRSGIEKAYLQVVDNNIIAKKLYAKKGFKEIYKYWYRIKD